MSAISHLAVFGFLVEHFSLDAIGNTLAERLTDLQHQWVKAHFDNDRHY